MRLSPLRPLCLKLLEDRHLLTAVFSEGFETDGQNVRYIASQPFNDQAADFWGRGSNAQFVGAADYLNPDGSSFGPQGIRMPPRVTATPSRPSCSATSISWNSRTCDSVACSLPPADLVDFRAMIEFLSNFESTGELSKMACASPRRGSIGLWPWIRSLTGRATGPR